MELVASSETISLSPRIAILKGHKVHPETILVSRIALTRKFKFLIGVYIIPSVVQDSATQSRNYLASPLRGEY